MTPLPPAKPPAPPPPPAATSRVTAAEAGAADKPAVIARAKLSIRVVAIAPSLAVIFGDAVRKTATPKKQPFMNPVTKERVRGMRRLSSARLPAGPPRPCESQSDVILRLAKG